MRHFRELMAPFVVAVLGTMGFALSALGGLSSCEQPIQIGPCWLVSSNVLRGCCDWHENFKWYRSYPCYPDKYTKGGTTVYWKDGNCQEPTGELCDRINESCPGTC